MCRQLIQTRILDIETLIVGKDAAGTLRGRYLFLRFLETLAIVLALRLEPESEIARRFGLEFETGLDISPGKAVDDRRSQRRVGALIGDRERRALTRRIYRELLVEMPLDAAS